MSTMRFGPNAGNYYSNIVQPVEVQLNFVVDHANGNGLGIRSLKSNGWVSNVFMHTSATPGTNNGYTNPNPASGLAIVQFKNNFKVYIGGFSGFVSPPTGSAVHINSTSLTVGNAYTILATGAVPAPHFPVTAVADVSGSLASKYFTLSDQFGNNFVIWYQVSGVGSAPALVGPLNGYQASPVSISTGAAASAVASATATVIQALNGSASFTASAASAVITVTGAASNTNLNFSSFANAQNSGFTIGSVTFTSLQSDWNIVGLPLGFTPNANAAFVAKATGDGGLNSTGTVLAVGASGIMSTEVIGDVNQTIANQSIAVNAGCQALVQFLNTSGAATAPGDNSVVGMVFKFDQSSVSVDGQ
jgi:hypothetical protein